MTDQGKPREWLDHTRIRIDENNVRWVNETDALRLVELLMKERAQAQAEIERLDAELKILKNPSDGRCMEIAALRESNKDLKTKLDVAVEALEFYSDEKNWTICEDYEGYVVEGFILSDDIESPKKEKNIWSGYGYGGKRARQALTKLKGDK